MKRTKFKSYEVGSTMIRDFVDALYQQDMITDETAPFLIELFNNRETEDGYKLKFEIKFIYESGERNFQITTH